MFTWYFLTANLQLNQELQLAVKKYQVNMLNPDRRLLKISDTNIAYLTDIIHNHQQHLREESHHVVDVTYTATATATASAPIVRSD